MKRTLSAAGALTLAALACSQAASAQEATVHWHLMGGYAETVGTTNQYLQGGGLVGGGFSVAWRGSPIEARFDLSYSEHNATSYLVDQSAQALNTQVDYGTGEIWSGTANIVLRAPLAYGVDFYGIGGIGAYHERVELNQYSPYGDFYCDPFSGFCYGGSAVVSSTGQTKFGLNAGVGLQFALPYGHAWFVEARYHRIETSTTPIEYVPITIGYRF
jgi:opacity protein-like surface antigen